MDEEGYLTLPEAGRVLSEDGQPIRIDDENFSVDAGGNITVRERQTDSGEDSQEEPQLRQLGTIRVVDFAGL